MATIKEDYEEIINILSDARTKISAIANSELILLKNRILIQISQHISSLSTQIGKKVEGELELIKSKKGTPVLRMFGKDISHVLDKQDIPNVAQSSTQYQKSQKEKNEEVDLEIIRDSRDKLISELSKTTLDKIFDSYDELVIRAAAKFVGLPVTETVPEIIDIKFLELLNDANEKRLALLGK